MTRMILGWLALGSAALILAGCPEQEAQALWVQHVIAADDSCLITATVGAGGNILPEGLVDLTVNREGYFAGIQVMNQLTSSQEATGLSEAEGQKENNNIQIYGATVHYDTNGSIALPQGFFVYAPLGLPPGAAGIAGINVLPPAVLQTMRRDSNLIGTKTMRDPFLKECFRSVTGQDPTWTDAPLGGRTVNVLVRVKYEGVLQDGTIVLSNEFRFPLRVCNGCLLGPRLDHPCQAPDLFGAGVAPEAAGCGAVVPCISGQDRCTLVRECYVNHTEIPQSAFSRLETCASNAALFPVSLQDPTCDSWIGRPDPAAGPGSVLQNLAYRYVLERMDAYCTIMDEAPLWQPPQ